MIKSILMVGFGGAAGSILRFAIQKILQPHSVASFPTGTFLINIVGCFLIGILWGITSRSDSWNEEIKLLLMTGLCGGFTTFSAFTLEGIGLLKENKTGLFLVYIGGTVILGLFATYIGIRLSK
jgi:fluoride exporter